MKNKLPLLMLFAIFLSLNLNAQDSTITKNSNWKHSFNELQLQARASFDYLGSYTKIPSTLPDVPNYQHWDTNFYGFCGEYFNFVLSGDIGSHISYNIRQRIIPKSGSVAFFDNTDLLNIQYKFNDNWSILLGKDALAIGGFENAAPPIDIYYNTHFWGALQNYQIGVSASYIDKSKKNKITLQVANSPYASNSGGGTDWQKGYFAYSLLWTGNFNHFSTRYSVNLIERERNKFIGYISLGHQLSFDKFQIYVDYMNRPSSFDKFFADFTIVSRLDYNPIPNVTLFAKAGYDQNFAENRFTDKVIDIMMIPDASYHFYGIGVEYRPIKYYDLRIHAIVANALMRYYDVIGQSGNLSHNGDYGMDLGGLSVNVGVSWTLDFLKLKDFIQKKSK